MPADQVAIGGELDVGLNAVGPNGEGMGVGGAGMFGVLGACTTVSENFHDSEPNHPGCPARNVNVNISCPIVDGELPDSSCVAYMIG